MSGVEVFGYLSVIFAGITLGIIGGGGSILTVPILVYFFKQNAMMATTHSLFVVGVTALIGAVMNARRGFVDYKMGAVFAVPSFVGVFFARKIILPLIPDVMELPSNLAITKPALILMSFATLMIFASRAMIQTKSIAPDKKDIPMRREILATSVKGFFVGAATGFVGAGGGFLIIPALVLMLRMPMRLAVGTSLLIIAVNSLFGFAVSVDLQSIDWALLSIITLLGTAGLFAGHHLSSRISESKLKKGFGYFVLIIGLLILAEQIFKARI